MNSFRTPRKIVVIMGDHDQIKTDEAEHVVATVKRFFISKDFDKTTYDCDIALLQMTKHIKFQKHIQPACLPSYG